MRSSTLLAVLMAAIAQGQSTSGQSMTTSPASSGSASSTHIPLFGVGATTIPISGVAGSIVGADSTATTIALNCNNGTPCVLGTNPITLTQGRSTWVADIVTQASIEGRSATVTAAVACKIISSTQAATCTATVTIGVEAQGQSSALTITTTTSLASSQINYEQLLITAGVEKLNNPSAAQTPSGAAGLVLAPVPTGNMAIGVGGMAAAAVVAVAGML
ncbi:hypothetical protein TMatcc_008642 [Talaromyces marneffei ATCC 18224]|uniref:GPI anchored cell wall protein n=1 Tax=Talaromyces marneffei PM1 TaxID=1077442 RepID=A0A093VQG0_TALMA|nr:uncharacterized protein EYB26_007971 [Talaromyces marneffei]KAE8550599.1 hypothetical protein EYB25_006827 [Talaromyces marneffei]QGA20269.1 hypothetical protein EYB26_007971 [Talaromyces marneffei]